MNGGAQRQGALDASAYDRWFGSAWGAHAFTVERDVLLRALGPLEGRRLVDVGCGTGRFTAAFEAAGAEVTALDRDEDMLALAGGRTRATLLRGDAHALPLRDDAFDVAVAVTLLEFATHAEQVIDELVRVTRPGGQVALATLNPRSPWGLARRRALRRPPWTTACLRTRRELRALVAGRGRERWHAGLYAPGAVPGLARIGPVLERVGRHAPALAAFQLVTLELPGPAAPAG